MCAACGGVKISTVCPDFCFFRDYSKRVAEKRFHPSYPLASWQQASV
jgi:hypothetical protein